MNHYSNASKCKTRASAKQRHYKRKVAATVAAVYLVIVMFLTLMGGTEGFKAGTVVAPLMGVLAWLYLRLEDTKEKA